MKLIVAIDVKSEEEKTHLASLHKFSLGIVSVITKVTDLFSHLSSLRLSNITSTKGEIPRFEGDSPASGAPPPPISKGGLTKWQV